MITSEARLREIYGEPGERAVKKVLDHIDPHARRFIAHSPFMLLATSDGERHDVSPKGDRPGFVEVAYETTLLVPDWPGNSRIDGYRNILRHPRVGMIFMIPNMRETLRVNGGASIHDETELLERCSYKGRLPLTVLKVAVEEQFFHCAKALLRSRLWQPDAWPERGVMPTYAEILSDQTGGVGPHETEEQMLARHTRELY